MQGTTGTKQGGATVVEYALVVSFIAAAVVATVILLGNRLETRYQQIVECVEDETAAACELD